MRDAAVQFEPKCGYDYFGNDLIAIIVYSLNDCMHACASWNWWKESSTPCVGVTFAAEMAPHILKDGGTCFLKKAIITNPSTGLTNVCSAILRS